MWTEWQTRKQTDEDVHRLFKEAGRRATCWGYLTGVGDLWAIDFDVPWVYGLWRRRFGARAETMTVETPNIGGRPYFLCKQPVTSNRFKETLHTELEGPGRFAITAGAIRRADGSMGEYRTATQAPILRDDRMPADTLAFLEEVLGRYEFTRWRCMGPHLDRVTLRTMPHHARLYTLDILILNGADDEELHNFYRGCDDYDRTETQGQIDAAKKKVAAGLKPPRCETLRRDLGWNEEGCQGCPRREETPARLSGEEKEATEERESQASALVRLAQAESVALFHDERQDPYIQICRGETLVTMRLRGKETRIWLSGLLWRDREKAPNSEALSSALNVLEAMANEGPEHRLYNRVAPGEDASIWLDLCNEAWDAVHITRVGWEVMKHPPILFRRYSHQQPLPTPIRGGSLAPLLDYAHITHLGDQLLYVVAVITYLVPDIPHVVLIFYGPQGAGKTWALRVIRFLIDPSQLDLLSLPTRYEELIQNLDHNWCAFYDNVGHLPDWQSNVFCRAVTGTGVSKRRLYTDDEDFICQYHRCIGFTDINIAAERGDLLQRSLLLGLDAIPEERQKTEKELKTILERKRPEILGAILDFLVKTMNFYSKANPPKLYRMADYTIWGLAITKALGIDPQHFLDAYQENIDAQNLESVRASPISDALILLMKLNPDGWSGTASQLYTALEDEANELKISTRQKAWPKKPHVLSRVLNELAPSLSAVGLEVERGYREKDRLIHISTIGSVGSVGDLKRQDDWGKGRDLRGYLSVSADATVATDDTSGSFPGDHRGEEEGEKPHEEKPPPSTGGTPAAAETLQVMLKSGEALGVRLQRENGGESITKMAFYGAAEKELGWSDDVTQKILKVLETDRRVFRPRPDALGFVGRAVGAGPFLVDGTPAPPEADGTDIDQEKLRRVSEALHQYGPILIDDLASGPDLPLEEVRKLLDRLRREGHAFQQVGGYWRWQP